MCISNYEFRHVINLSDKTCPQINSLRSPFVHKYTKIPQDEHDTTSLHQLPVATALRALALWLIGVSSLDDGLQSENKKNW